MGKPDIDMASLIRDLYASSPSKRQQALDGFDKNWTLELRPYLWKAIEQEESKEFQQQMVELAIRKLREKSLRRLIRFVEKDQLFSKSNKRFIEAYIDYETPEVREALIKSLLRDNSKTYQFVGDLIFSDKFYEFPDGKGRSLIKKLLSSEIPDHLRKQFLFLAFKKSLIHDRKPLDKNYLLDIIENDPFLHIAFLELFFMTDEDIKIQRKVIPKIGLIWDRWIWSSKTTLNKNDIGSKFNQASKKIGIFEDFIIKSLNTRNTQVRNATIKILSRQVIADQPPIFNHNSNNRENFSTAISNLYHTWGLLAQERLDWDFANLGYFEQATLDDFFSESASEIYAFIKTFKIDLNTLSEFILAYYPRKLLISLAENDPDENNRYSAYTALLNQNFWYNGNYIGPVYTWVKMIMRIIKALQYENQMEIYEVTTELLFLLLNLTQKMFQSGKDEFEELLREKLLPNKIEQLKSLPHAVPVVSQLEAYLLDKPLEIYQDIEGLGNTAHYLVTDLVKTIDEFDSKTTLIGILKEGKTALRYGILKNIETKIENEGLSSIDQADLKEILKIAKYDSNVKIRTLSMFIAQKYNIGLD